MRFRPAAFGTYLVLFVLGAVQGLLGSFQYSRDSPLGAILLVLLIAATCLLSAWGANSPSAAFMVALGWVLAAFVLSLPQENGSVIIAATTSGKWFLYGGAVAVALSVVISFAFWSFWTARQPRKPLQARCHRLDPGQRPVEFLLGDDQRWCEPDRRAVRLLRQHARTG